MSKSLLIDDPESSIRKYLQIGLAVGAIFVVGLGGWGFSAEISGAVMARGQLVVESDVKKVQHQNGGIVGELNVSEGQRVRAGDVLVKLDPTTIRSNLAIIENTLKEQEARQARLEAERDERDELVFGPGLLDRRSDPDVMRIITSEQRMFTFRRAARLGQKSQLTERMAQLREQIRGLTIQAKAKADENTLIDRELEGVHDLYAKKLVPLSRVTALERDATRIEGERGSLITNIAQQQSRIGETELQMLQVDQDMRTEVSKDLQDAQAKIAEQRERRVAALDQLNRIEIRAPQDGVVHQLAIHTIGGVIAPGDPIMMIVPTGDDLLAEVRVPPDNIDQVHLHQPTSVRFTGLNQRISPEVDGVVSRISANSEFDQHANQSFYTVRVSIPPTELARLKGVKFVPGMPVETFIKTGDRTAVSYLTKPLTDQIARAFREK